MKAKSLVKSMTRHELIEYVLNHPQWKIPTALEAEALDIGDIEWDSFRVDEELSGRDVIYNKRKQCYKTTHPLFRNKVVLINQKENK